MNDDKYVELLIQVSSWCNRAQMAQKQSNAELTRQALVRCWDYQCAVAKVILKPEPEPPKTVQDVLDWIKNLDPGARGKGPDLPRDPYQPSRVPLRPLPTSGAGAIALPLPEKPDEE